MKRVIALLLTLVMLLGLVPTALAAEAAAPDGTVVKAEEVSGTPRLDAMAENDSAGGLCREENGFHQLCRCRDRRLSCRRPRGETGCRHSPGSEKGFCRDPGGPARRSPGGGHPHCRCP